MRRVWVAAVTLLGCDTIFGLDDPQLRDAGSLDAALSDAGTCTVASSECASDDVLRTCSGPGADAVDTVCTWGCLPAPAHCGQLVPAGGAVVSEDLAPDAQLVNVTLDGVTVNSDTGAITTPLGMVRGAGSGIVDGIGFETRGSVGVFRFGSLAIDGPIAVTGTHALALVSNATIRVNAVVDVRGPCTQNTAGPGGLAGGGPGQNAPGSGGGQQGTNAADGGGGGGHGGSGGRGGQPLGNGAAGGASFGMAAIPLLVGGGGGGGGGDTSGGGLGGGGGGAVQLASNTAIEIATAGGINAGGCGGKPATLNRSGGGGGAGGTILLEAPSVTIAGTLAVNGGAGAGGSDVGEAGQPGQLARTAAAGGASGNGANGRGGNGAAAAATDGAPGGDATRSGGGGGAIGRMRFHTRAGSATVDASAVLSPSLDDSTTTTEAAATVE